MRRKTLLNIVSLYFFIFVAWGYYRFNFQLSEWLEELIIKPAIWLTPTLLLLFCQERKNLASIGLTARNLFKNIYFGWGLGSFFAFEGLIANAIKYRGFLFVPMGLSLIDILKMVVIALITALVEELVFRGYLLTRLVEVVRDDLWANLTAGILFSLIHLPMAIFVLQYDLSSIISYLFLMLVLGVADGYIFLRTKSLVAPTISHALWNFSVILFR